MEVAIYVHIPFCERKCLYCDFNSYGGFTVPYEAYVDALCLEMAEVAARGREAGIHYVTRTLYFGGGTPTLLSPLHFEKLLDTARKHFSWHERVETTTEANPGTIDVASMRELRGLGINRVSLGVQSLDDGALRRLGRIHDSRQALQAVDACRKSGIDNLNLDFMYGLPGQDLAHWRGTLDQAISLAPEHFSLYPLTIELDTPFWHLRERGQITVASDDESAEMYELAAEELGSAGYEHYELSNWAMERQGSATQAHQHRSEHNLTYWRNQPYIGFGAGAHSFVHSERYSNVRLPSEYVRLIEATANVVDFRERIGRGLEMAETLILGLRLSEGVRRSVFRDRFERDLDDALGNVLPQVVRQGLVVDEGDAILLSPRGKLLANEVFVPILNLLAHLV